MSGKQNILGKRSNFPKIPKGAYDTIDPRAVKALLPFLPDKVNFAEPCAGKGYLIRDLQSYGHTCVYEGDIITGQDAFDLTEESVSRANIIITNVNWDRKVFMPMVQHLSSLRPTWTLMDAGWMLPAQSSDMVKNLLTDIIALPRLRWIPNTTMSGMDDCVWLRFDTEKNMDTRFHGR